MSIFSYSFPCLLSLHLLVHASPAGHLAPQDHLLRTAAPRPQVRLLLALVAVLLQQPQRRVRRFEVHQLIALKERLQLLHHMELLLQGQGAAKSLHAWCKLKDLLLRLPFKGLK